MSSKEIEKLSLTPDIDLISVIDSWTKFYEQSGLVTSSKDSDKSKNFLSDEEIFAEAYTYLISSPFLETMFQLENEYQLHLDKISVQRGKELENLKIRNQEEMNHALFAHVDDKTISLLANKQSEELHLLESRWDSTLSSSKALHKKEFREWVMKVYEDDSLKLPNSTNTDLKIINGSNSKTFGHNVASNSYGALDEGVILAATCHVPFEKGDRGKENVIREESFTINLGNQLKLSHNLRLVKCSLVGNFCGDVTSRINYPMVRDGSNDSNVHRLQTLLSLYSNRISALIVLEDSNTYDCCVTDPDLSAICENFPDYHFPELGQQLEIIRKEATNKLMPGDVYITRHSNLSDVQVIFHLCVDDAVKRGNQDLTSRHSVFTGIRNIFKTCCLFEVTSITMPLLLVPQITEEMTMNWCHKRAELVFKCVKGFMMEMQSWGCSESKTVQFQLPTKICDEAFDSITAMLPNIFRLPAPITH